jgi:hypothetical protein
MDEDHPPDGVSIYPCDKTLATTPALRDNAVVGMLDTVADRWQARQEAHGSPGIVVISNCGRLLP